MSFLAWVLGTSPGGYSLGYLHNLHADCSCRSYSPRQSIRGGLSFCCTWSTLLIDTEDISHSHLSAAWGHLAFAGCGKRTRELMAGRVIFQVLCLFGALTSRSSSRRFWPAASVFFEAFFFGRTGRVSCGSKTSSGKSKLEQVSNLSWNEVWYNALANVGDSKVMNLGLITRP